MSVFPLKNDSTLDLDRQSHPPNFYQNIVFQCLPEDESKQHRNLMATSTGISVFKGYFV